MIFKYHQLFCIRYDSQKVLFNATCHFLNKIKLISYKYQTGTCKFGLIRLQVFNLLIRIAQVNPFIWMENLPQIFLLQIKQHELQDYLSTCKYVFKSYK